MNNLYGLLGEKLEHSLSPEIHSLIFKELNIEGYYHLFEVEKNNLEKAIAGLNVLGAKGLNVTIPYKIDIIKYLDRLSDEAEKIGAVNTIVLKNNKMIGCNTDYLGFGMMLEKHEIDCKNQRAVILGTGGASKAVSQYLLDNGIREIIFVSRDKEKGKKRYTNYKVISYEDTEDLRDIDMIINCTPVGMYPNTEKSPLRKDDLKNAKVVIDLIYNPRKTLLLKYAEEMNIKAVNGLYMLVGQAVKAEELWNGVKIRDENVDSVYNQIKIFF